MLTTPFYLYFYHLLLLLCRNNHVLITKTQKKQYLFIQNLNPHFTSLIDLMSNTVIQPKTKIYITVTTVM